MQLREGTSVLIRSNGDVQIGLGRKSAVFSGLDPSEQSFLQSLRFPAAGGAATERARKRGIPRSRVELLTDLLNQHELTQSEPEPNASADAHRLLRRDGHTRSLANRADVRVDIVTFSCGDPVQFLKMKPYISALVETLQSASITRIGFDYRGRDMGGLSRAGLGELVGLEQPLHSEPHFVIALFARASSAALVHPWQEAGIPHVSIVFHEDCIQIGPFVRPGGSPCLKCVDRNFRDLDPEWPALQIQCRDQPFPSLSPELSKTTAIMTARLVANELDGVGVVAGEVRFVDENFVVERATWPQHHDCGCTTGPDAPDPVRSEPKGPDSDISAEKDEDRAGLERTRECVGV